MRDPNRIPWLLEAVQRYWEKNPDLRLGQIVGNMAKGTDPYYIEDDELHLRISAALIAAEMDEKI